MKRPLVVTLRLDDAATEHFDDLRRRHFPPGRTEVGAHVTLFHAVPDVDRDGIVHDLTELGARQVFPVSVSKIRSLGHGVAYDLTSSELDALHRELQRRWWSGLTKQDRQGFRGHVTVQNKVTPKQATETLRELQADFTGWDVRATGLRLWRYDGGPWTHLHDVAFGPSTPAAIRDA